MRQVVSISADGQDVSGLQRKPGQGFDLRKLGHARIERASEIVFDEEMQRWHVHVIKGVMAGTRLAGWDFIRVLNKLPAKGFVNLGSFIVEFDDYDDAVAAEIAFLDQVRLKEGAAALE